MSGYKLKLYNGGQVLCKKRPGRGIVYAILNTLGRLKGTTRDISKARVLDDPAYAHEVLRRLNSYKSR